MTRYVASSLICIFLATVAQAEVDQLSQTELRVTVSEHNALPPRQIVASVEAQTGGDVLDLQAFFLLGVLTYRILLRNDAGEVRVVLVNGMTGNTR